MSNNAGFIVTTADELAMTDLIRARGALKAQILTGMKHSGGSVIANAIQRGWLPEGTRKLRSAYTMLNELVVMHGGQNRPLI